jgi:hypothetical protein
MKVELSPLHLIPTVTSGEKDDFLRGLLIASYHIRFCPNTFIRKPHNFTGILADTLLD